MKAQVTGNSISITLHLALIAAFWLVNAQVQMPVPPVLLDLNILQGVEESNRQQPVSGPPAAVVPPPPQPDLQDTQPPPEKQTAAPVVLQAKTRKKVVREKVASAEQPQTLQAPVPAVQDLAVQSGNPQRAAADSTEQQDMTAAGDRPAQHSGIYRQGEIDESLTALKRAQPAYPASARRRNIEGWVQVQFVVNEHGKPEQIRILAAEPHDIFDSSVIGSISRWRFRPGTINGMAVRVLVEQTIRFQLH